MPNISIHVDETRFNLVSRLPCTMDRSKSWVVTDALKPYLAHHLWMIEETEKALAEVRSGTELIDHKEIMDELTSYAESLDQ